MSIWLAENERNARNADLYKAIIREVYGADEIGIGHHLMFRTTAGATDEQPSADTLTFDHTVAKKLWGSEWMRNLPLLALTPAETRDALLGRLFYSRS